MKPTRKAAKVKAVRITQEEIGNLISFFALWLCALVLEPGNNRAVRSTLASLGFIEKRGKLALTASGEKLLTAYQSGKQFVTPLAPRRAGRGRR